MELQQRHIIKFLHLKDLKLDDIVTKLFDVYGQDVSAKPSIKYWLHPLRLGRKDLTTQHMGGRPTLGNTNNGILSILRGSLFSSVRAIADSLGILASTVYFHLVKRLGSKTTYSVESLTC
jgi:hypothetical protein